MSDRGNSNMTAYIGAAALGVGCLAMWKMMDNQRAAAVKAERSLMEEKLKSMELQQELKMQAMQLQHQQQMQMNQMQSQSQFPQQQSQTLFPIMNQPNPNQPQQGNNSFNQSPNQAQQQRGIPTPYGQPPPPQPGQEHSVTNFSLTRDAPTPQESFTEVPPGGAPPAAPLSPCQPGASTSQFASSVSLRQSAYADNGPPTYTSVKSGTYGAGNTYGAPGTGSTMGSTLNGESSLMRNQSMLYRDNTGAEYGAPDSTMGSTLGAGSAHLGPSASGANFGSPNPQGGAPHGHPQQRPHGNSFNGLGNETQNSSFDDQRPRSESQVRRGETQNANDSVADFLAKKKAMTEVKLDLLHHVPSFRGVNEKFLERIAGHLQHESFNAHDSICTEGEYGDCMYFVAGGQCEGWRKGAFFKKFTEGHYFGEIALLRGVVRAVTVRALTACDLFYLSRDPFLEAIAEFPEVRDAMEKEVILRYEEAKYSSSQRKDPHIRKKIEDSVQIQFAKMKAQFNKKMKWQLNQKIGSGAAGDVYSAINLGTGQPMAVKVMAMSGASKSLLLSVQQESEMMQRLHHPNLVQGYGLEKDETEGNIYIFMELLPMGCIQKQLKEFGPMSETACRVYAKQMLKGLQYLHEHGVLHRDIKPANMLISAQGTVKLADFGISRYGTSVATQTITGTPAYMSPDSINGKYSIASDIWAMGCSILEMITRTVPWNEMQLEGPTQLIFHIAMCNTTPKLPQAYDREEFAKHAANGHERTGGDAAANEDGEEEEEEAEDKISPMLHDLLLKMMATDPQARGDCAALLEHEWFSVDVDMLPSQPHKLSQLTGRDNAYGSSDDEDEGEESSGLGGAKHGTCTSIQNAFASGVQEDYGGGSREQTPATQH